MSKLIEHNQSNSFASPEVRVVEASAGSGKTFALAKRYVQLLILSSSSPAGLRSILAITFTNKAAVEMKARILDFLKKIALSKLSDVEKKEIILPLNLTEHEASARAYAVMEGLIRNYNFFQVQTIDSFINALLCGCSFKINLSANFNIKRNSREYLSGALDRLIDLAVTDKTIYDSFHQFLHQYLFIENRSGWFPKKDLLKILAALFSQSNFYSLDFLNSPVQSLDLILAKKEILKLMREPRYISKEL
jgi:ATP-dependent exoDNAse (exonuclease V) beta subunit